MKTVSNKRSNYLTTKVIFTITVIVVVFTIVAVWLFGLGQHRSIYNNSILSTTILSAGFFLFVLVGLYKGVILKDNIGKLTDKLSASAGENLPHLGGVDLVGIGDDAEGVIVSILLWIVATIFIGLFLWFFGVVLWTAIVAFIAMLYWVYFRAVRLVFKNSVKCKGNLQKSVVYGLSYTLLYNCWIYGIIFLAHYFGK